MLSGAIRKLRELQQENEALRQENRDMKTNIAIITDCVTKAFLYGVPPFSGTGTHARKRPPPRAHTHTHTHTHAQQGSGLLIA